MTPRRQALGEYRCGELHAAAVAHRRRRRFLDFFAADDGALFVLMLSAFAGPEQVPDDLVDEGWPDRLRGAA